MNKRQMRFAREYAVDGNGAAAARRAGYSEKQASAAAHRLLSRSDVKVHIDALHAAAEAENRMQTSYAIDLLIDRATAPSIVEYTTLTDEGEVIWKDPSELNQRQLDGIRKTIPVKNVLNHWQAMEVHDKVPAVIKLIDMLNPTLSESHQQIIMKALTQLGADRGMRADQMVKLHELLLCRSTDDPAKQLEAPTEAGGSDPTTIH